MKVLLHLVDSHTITAENVLEITRDAGAAGMTVVEYVQREHLIDGCELSEIGLFHHCRVKL
jgi:hypothetical protein